METLEFWNEIGSKKEFNDPLFTDYLSNFMSRDSKILDFGCGYGRTMHILKTKGYDNTIGFDPAPKMIERGKNLYPSLNLNTMTINQKLPLENHEVDVVIISTVLCCSYDKNDQMKIFEEVKRVLKRGGALYLSDFIICKDPVAMKKYEKGFLKFQDFGVYKTSEGAIVRHHTTDWLMQLLKGFDIQWFEQFDFTTMNNSPARIFHAISLLV